MLSCVICTYVFTPHGIRPSDLSDKFCGIKANLNDVVEQSKRGSQREGGHEQRHKPILDYCKYEYTGKEAHTVKRYCVIAVVSNCRH